MSVKSLSQVWGHSAQRLGPLLVLLALADFSDDSGLCWPSIATIAKKARMRERQVQRILRDLEACGEIVLERRLRDNGSTTSNLYRIKFLGGEGVKMTPSPLAKRHRGDGSHDTGGAAPMTPPEPSLEPSEESQSCLPLPSEAGKPAFGLPVIMFPLKEDQTLPFPYFSTVGTASPFWCIQPDHEQMMRTAFPDLDVQKHCRSAWGWVAAKRSRRKTAGGMMKFLMGWLERAQNGGEAARGQMARLPSLSTLYAQRTAVQNDIDAILHPGGCAGTVRPEEPGKIKRLEELLDRKHQLYDEISTARRAAI